MSSAFSKPSLPIVVPEGVTPEAKALYIQTYAHSPVDAYKQISGRLFTSALKNSENQNVNFDLSFTRVGFNKAFVPSAVAQRSYLYLQLLCDAGFSERYFTKRENLQSYLLAVTTSGRGQLMYRGATHTLEPGDVFLLDCRRLHEYRAASPDGWDYIMVHFDGMAMRDHYAQILAGGSVKFHFDADSAFNKLLDALFAANCEERPDREIRNNSILTQMITEILLTLPQFHDPLLPDYLQDICSWLDAHCQEAQSLDAIASRFGISKYHLSREFKRHLGRTIFEYLQDSRVKLAKILLRCTDCSVSEITEQIGYSDQSSFTRLFRSMEGISPSEYRRQWKGR